MGEIIETLVLMTLLKSVAKHLVAGNPKASTTTSVWKLSEGTRLIAEPNGNNVDDVTQWAIRSVIT